MGHIPVQALAGKGSYQEAEGLVLNVGSLLHSSPLRASSEEAASAKKPSQSWDHSIHPVLGPSVYFRLLH